MLRSDEDEIDKLMAKKICYHCVKENYLSNEIKSKGKRLKCSYCNSIQKCYRVNYLADRVKLAFEQHYTRTSQQPTDLEYAMLVDKESHYQWVRDGELVVYAIIDAANIPEGAANDIQEILANECHDLDSAALGEECEFASDSYYEQAEPGDASWQKEWDKFEHSLKTEARFFSRTAAKHLASIFEDISEMTSRDNRPLVKAAGPGTTLTKIFRARVFQSEEKLKEALCCPDQQLGAPPSMFATAGRMNAHGISVFYGATDPKTARAEVRPPVGSWVAVACFEIIRPLRLLNLTALSHIEKKEGSIFDPTYAKHIERITFLKKLCQRIARPIMPDDAAFEYLITQAIADFLATEAEPEIDGIIFPSTQVATAGLNIVLFHKAAQVMKIELPLGTELYATSGSYDEEGEWVTDYTVSEEVPLLGKNELNLNDIHENKSLEHDCRQPTSIININSIYVHSVNSVEFKAELHKVKRRRSVKDEGYF